MADRDFTVKTLHEKTTQGEWKMQKTSARGRRLAGLASGAAMLALAGIPTAHAADLSFWCLTIPGIDDVVAAFGKDNPDIHVKFTQFQSEDFKTQLRVTVASGEIPDVYCSNEGFTFFEYVNRGAALDITDIIGKEGWRNEIFPDFIKADTDKNGHVWGVPWSTIHYWQAIFYDKGFFAKNNIAIPKSIAELVDVAAKVQAAGRYPVSFGDKDGWPGLLLLGDLFLQQAPPGYVDDLNSGKVKWTDSDVARNALQAIETMGTKGVFAPGFLTSDHQAAIMAWAGGKAAMLYNGTWWPGVTGSADTGFDIGVMPLPRIAPEQPLKGTQFWASNHVLISSKVAGDAKDAAIKFVGFLLSDKAAAIMGAAAGAVTSNPVANKALKVAAYFNEPAFTDQAKLPKMGYFDHAFPIPVIEELKVDIQKLMQGSETVQAALEAVEKVHAEERAKAQ
jgi:raffinose/stachyose/melibiose transport system substrate-binding protein